ncbi:Flp pilus assembly protein TadG [Bradyrhizobium niftali]|uniref:TadE/TadG family type IV pilus assembly protein n=1 Tax=Bradyrhizobium niftali TaxID=2560055 RepID=UPI0038334E50
MRKLDRRGTAALEFCLVAVPLFTLMFAIFDFGRYAITMQSLRTLSDAAARAIMIGCYSTAAIQKTTPSCSGDPLSDAQKQDAAPYLYMNGGSTPTVSAPAAASSPATVTASQPGFTMIMPIWGTSLNAPSASTKVPF